MCCYLSQTLVNYHRHWSTITEGYGIQQHRYKLTHVAVQECGKKVKAEGRKIEWECFTDTKQICLFGTKDCYINGKLHREVLSEVHVLLINIVCKEIWIRGA